MNQKLVNFSTGHHFLAIIEKFVDLFCSNMIRWSIWRAKNNWKLEML